MILYTSGRIKLGENHCIIWVGSKLRIILYYSGRVIVFTGLKRIFILRVGSKVGIILFTPGSFKGRDNIKYSRQDRRQAKLLYSLRRIKVKNIYCMYTLVIKVRIILYTPGRINSKEQCFILLVGSIVRNNNVYSRQDQQ